MTHSVEKNACTCDSRRSHYHRAAVVKRIAQALQEAADAWDDDSPENLADLRELANNEYRAGGPSMPAIWLRRRAETYVTSPVKGGSQ